MISNDPLDILHQGNLGVEAGIGLGFADNGAELTHKDLLGRVDRVEGLSGQEGGDREQDHDDNRTGAHRVAPCAGGVWRMGGGAPWAWFDLSSGSGR